MRVHLSGSWSIECNELVTEVFTAFLPRLCVASKVGESMSRNRWRSNLGLEDVHLVQEENERGHFEPVRVSYRFPEHKSFLHLVLHTCQHNPKCDCKLVTYAIFVFCKTLIVTTDRDQKHQSIHTFKAVDPLLSFGSLSSHVKHTILQVPEIETCFGDASSTKSCAQDILIRRNEFLIEKSVEILKEAIVHVSVLQAFLYPLSKRHTMADYRAMQIHFLFLPLSALHHPSIDPWKRVGTRWEWARRVEDLFLALS